MILDRARAKPGALGALRLSIYGFGAALAAALAGCSTSTHISNGTPVVTVTAQAAGDFSTYVVGITVYSLTRSDGYVTYPAGYTAEEFADLTQQVDLTELLNAVGVPTGTYKSAVIGIDYSTPIVYLKGQSTGATVQNTSAVNPGIVYVTVTFDPSHQLVVGVNQTTPLALDFDVGASNSIVGNTVTVKPFVEAVTPSNDTEPIRARGLFVAANSGSNNFIENLRPFEDNVYSTVGALTVNTTSSTYYNIDGKVYTGAAGLTALAAAPSNTPVVAYGTLAGTPPGSTPNNITPALTATQVYGGTVVSNGQFEHVRGVVSAVNGNSLTVRGATYLYYEGYCVSNLCYTYYPSGTVNVSSSTLVTEDGTLPPSGTNFSTRSISVGSQIDAVGVGSTSAGALTLDATSGLVRLQSTPLWATLDAGTASSATLSLYSLGTTGFPANTFTFAGTGSSAASYEVDTAALGTAGDESATPAGTLLRVDGFPTAYGTAPPDFDATAVTPGSSEPADLMVEWKAGTTTPFTSQDSTSLVLNLADEDVAEVVTGPQSDCSGGATPACTPLTGTPAITIAGANQFAIGNATNGVSVFSTSSAFAGDLGSTLNGSTKVFRVVAIGSYDSATNTFTANRVDVALE